MRVTAKFLRGRNCCYGGVDRYFAAIRRKSWDAKKLLEYAIERRCYADAAWAIACAMTKDQRYRWVRRRTIEYTVDRSRYTRCNIPRQLRKGLDILLESKSDG